MKLTEAVARDPEVMSGALCFKGTRVPVYLLFDALKNGRSTTQFLTSYSWLNPDAVEAVLSVSQSALEDLKLAS